MQNFPPTTHGVPESFLTKFGSYIKGASRGGRIGMLWFKSAHREQFAGLDPKLNSDDFAGPVGWLLFRNSTRYLRGNRAETPRNHRSPRLPDPSEIGVPAAATPPSSDQ